MSDQTAQQAARLALALSRVSRSIRRQQSLPLGTGGVSALATISREGPLRLSDLAAREGLSAASLSRLIAVLEGDGYVVRQADASDRRSFLVSTTPQGEALLGEVRNATAAILLQMLERLAPGERAAILAAIPALEALAEERERAEVPG